MEKHSGYKIAFPVLFIIIGIWIGGWFFSLTPEFGSLTNQPVNDIFNSLNALFAGLAFGGVIITVYLQIEELKDTRKELGRTSEANQRMAEDSNEKAVLDLYQTYCSEYFQEIKTSSMTIFIGCIKDKEYCDFVVSRFFVAEQLPLKENHFKSLQDIIKADNFSSFRDEEQKHRYKVDELINFFSILTAKINSKEIIKNCDFFYPWWRPLFWLIAIQQKKRYQEFQTIPEYSGDLLFPDVVIRLDEIYGFKPFETDEQAWQHILSHPKITSYGIDSKYQSQLEVSS
tara:strand:- start:469 stop:1326 length:858 start_codon:yes stop_codon:yes gene_type:complete